MRYAIDCAFDFPSPVAAADLGYVGMVRYFARHSSQTNAKLWNQGQINLCHAAGLWVFGVFEQQADDPLLGYDRGKQDAQIAEEQWDLLGAPDGTVIAYAYDFDPHPAQVVDYARGVRDGSSGHFPTMAYSSDAVAVELFKDGLIDYFWQTESAGFQGVWPSPRAHLIQHTWYELRPKLNNDYDENVIKKDFPWWGPQGLPTTEEDDVYINVKPGETVVIPVKDNATVSFAADSTTSVRFAHGPNAGPSVEDVSVPKFSNVSKKLTKASVVSIVNNGAAPVGVSVTY